MKMDARWTDVQEYFCRAANHFKMSRMIFDTGGLDADDTNGYMARMALMHSMQTGYTVFEDGLKKIFTVIEEPITLGGDTWSWETALLARASKNIKSCHGRPSIFSPQFLEIAGRVRRFRHIAATDYDNFNTAEASGSVEAATLMAKNLMTEFERFREAMDEFERFREAMEAGSPKQPPRPPRG
jgi:hypothetical protein